jgi:hypothetical protein
MPASSPSPFPIHPGTRNWPCSTGRFSPALVRRKPPATPRPVRWISIGKASGFPTARWPLEGREPYHLGQFTSHHRLATPVSPWERLKIGGGTPPILTRHGWLIVYHGVSEMVEPGPTDTNFATRPG